MIIGGTAWDEPGGRCSQCGDRLPNDSAGCRSSQCNQPGNAIGQRIDEWTRAENERLGRLPSIETRYASALTVLELEATEADDLNHLRNVVLILIRELAKAQT